ncbi:unnamed protein product [Ixodes hexagonus]
MDQHNRRNKNEKTFTALHWNCRGLRGKKSEPKLRLNERKTTVDVILLQETHEAEMKLTGFVKYDQPSITLTVKGKTKVQPQSAILVRKDILPQKQVDTGEWCTDSQEVVAVLVESECDGPILVVSVPA